MQKVLILCDDFPPKGGGGAAVIAGVHAQGLVQAGYHVIVVTTVNDSAQETLKGVVDASGIIVYKIYSDYHPRWRSWRSLWNPPVIKKLEKILQQEKPDIIHTHNIHYHFSYHSLSLAKRYCKALFHTIHDSMPFHYSKLFPNSKVTLLRQLKDFKLRFNPFRKNSIKRYLKHPDKIFAVSNALKDALKENGIENVEVIHNGIDIGKWKNNEQGVVDFKKKYGLVDKKVMLFCGRLSRAKGGDILIKNMPHIIKEVPNAVLLIVGDKTSEIEGSEGYLIFTGKLLGNALINAFGASDVLLTPSLCFDWFPTVNLEAMAMKKPVIATCYGGSKEAVLDSVTGYIINPNNQQELIQKVISILKDPKQFGELGYERVKKEFTIEKYIQTTITWYNIFLK